MKKARLLICGLVCATVFSQTQAQTTPKSLSQKPFSIGETVTLRSAELGEERSLNIYLPSGFHPDSVRQYPVIYLLDGSADEDFIHVSGLVQFGNFPWINMLPESIVVGIANVDRKRDYTYPTTIEKDKKDFPTTGGSAKFIQFLEKELQPFIEQNYSSNDTTTLIGQSLGGLLATEVLFKKPELFANYIIISPSLWWDDQSLFAQMPKFAPAQKSIYIGVGKKEPKVMVKTAKRLAKKIEVQHVPGFRVHHQLFNAADHGNILHLALYDAFGWVF